MGPVIGGFEREQAAEGFDGRSIIALAEGKLRKQAQSGGCVRIECECLFGGVLRLGGVFCPRQGIGHFGEQTWSFRLKREG